ncbi:MAG: SAM-dependent methyltransferase [Prevotella sp.]|nr:SAM-dependent methyltransferase [Prevotella sp.]MCM1074531.1 SAM-dependent methyltransferase [Ruminococcus sp.]
MKATPILYLIPVNLSDAPLLNVLPYFNIEVVKSLRHFIVENVRTARRFLKRCSREIDIGTLTFSELNVHTDPATVSEMLEPMSRGEDIGVMSEAGCPGVADPGALVVSEAQKRGYKVVPLVGPSSILLSLMASGFNGQGFTFHGYLTIGQAEREKRIKALEADSRRTGMTHIFIETPYRNDKLLETLAKVLQPNTLVCVASAITDPEHESIVTRPAAKWKSPGRSYHKIPTIFLLSAK